MESNSVPITIQVLYREYERLLSRGLLELEDISCPKRRVSRCGRGDGAHADESDASPRVARAR